MSFLPFMSLVVADISADTQFLSLEESGCYFRLLEAAWKNGGHIPDNDRRLASAVRISEEKWLALRTVMEPLFEIGKQGWFQQKMLDRIAEISASSDRRKKAGKLGGKAKSLKQKANQVSNASSNASSIATDNYNHNYNYNQESESKKESSSAQVVPDSFQQDRIDVDAGNEGIGREVPFVTTLSQQRPPKVETATNGKRYNGGDAPSSYHIPGIGDVPF